MPLSALSPDGPVTLVGVDPASVERMRDRNRKEKLFTAKCCGAPVQIRTAEGKIPHFVHLSTPEFCEGDRLETPEHRRLKHKIAFAIASAGWEVETEACERDNVSGRAIWRADVLATRRKGKVAFEVQLSNADWTAMSERQERYRRYGVRGLWFVKTKKGFPATEAMPVFVLEKDDDGDWVRMSRRWDSPDIWNNTDGAEYIELSKFIHAALAGRLKWAPFLSQTNTTLDAKVYSWPIGACKGCRRTLVDAHAISAKIASDLTYPDFYWHTAMRPRHRTKWFNPILNSVWTSVANNVSVSFVNANNTCGWCLAPIEHSQTTYRSIPLAAQIELKALPKATFGTVEWDWLRRWVLIPN